MRIEDFKRWHWIVIAIVVGLVGGYVYSGLTPIDPGRSVSGDDFRRFAPRVSQNDATQGWPLVRKVVVYPAEKGAYGKPVNVVHFEQLYVEPSDRTKYEYRTAHLNAEIPFVPGGAASNSVLDFLREAKTENDALTFREAWESKPAAVYGLSMLASLVVIGGAWPTFVNALTGAGYGKRPEPKATDLRHVRSTPEEKPAAKRGVDAAEHAKLAGMVNSMEASLGRGRGGGGAGDSVAGESTDPAVRKLDGKPLVTQPGPKKEEAHDYKGEYYPVDRGPKKD